MSLPLLENIKHVWRYRQVYSDIHAYTTPFTNPVGVAWITVPDGRTLGLKSHMGMGVYVLHEELFPGSTIQPNRWWLVITLIGSLLVARQNKKVAQIKQLENVEEYKQVKNNA